MSALAASIDAVWEADLLTGTARSPGVEELKKRALAIRSAGTRLMPCLLYTSPSPRDS